MSRASDPSRLPGSARGRSATAWGLVGALSFLVLHQGYLLAGGRFVGFLPVAGTAVLVGLVAGLSAYVLEPRLAGRNEQR